MLEGKTVKTVERKSLIGERIILRPFGKRDLLHIQRWSTDAELRRLIGEVAPMNRADTEKWYTELLADKDRVWFAIVLKKGNRVIGEAGLLRMFRPWRSTDMTIIIGERDAWGKGYGKEAGRLLLNYAFEHLGFHRVSIGVVGFNKNALMFWKSLGFKKEGVERDAHFYDNKFSDGIMMSILEHEYRKNIKNAT
ncbi:MAG TPA: GNAT family protein [candidate division Zixibacteria bacterium]|nr:GNAT family protein [candidate division Zixibacteria bacterium]